jgi:hypothetical protein
MRKRLKELGLGVLFVSGLLLSQATNGKFDNSGNRIGYKPIKTFSLLTLLFQICYV